VSALIILNTKTASLFPYALSVSVPVSPASLSKQYTPEVRINPPQILAGQVGGAGLPHQIVVGGSGGSLSPFGQRVTVVNEPPTTVPGGKPVTASPGSCPPPGQTPTSPLTVVTPVLVTVEPPRIANGTAVPSDGAV
jgi:hypothetical protein